MGIKAKKLKPPSITTQAQSPVFQREVDTQPENPLQAPIWQPGVPATDSATPASPSGTGHNFGNIPVHSPNNPAAIQSRLGAGQALAPATQSRMGQAFGHSFSNVRVHRDATATRLSSQHNARALTVGNHVAFGQGEYHPGTPMGDALIAHELAHVVQQGGAGQSVSPMEHNSTGTSALEKDADHSAIGVMTRLWGNAKGASKKIAKNAMPRLRSGLQIAKCDKADRTAEEKAKTKDPKLLADFAGKFSDAAALIRSSTDAMKLINEAVAAGVEFGGYAEDGPAKDAWAYTVGTKVYVPKARTDKVLAVSDFLFELNNAVRAPTFAKLSKEAAKGSKGTLTAKQYAYKKVEQEVEGMLRMGEIWFEMKKTIGKGAKWNKYDNDFYLSEYEAFKAKTKSKDDIVKEVLQRKYTSGVDKGKTVEQYYMEQYNDLSGGK